jgi:hypothetical protein
MFENSYDASAKLTSLIRYWYDASDSPGISAVDRIVEKFFFVFLWVFLLSKMIFFLGDEARGYFYDVS